MSRIDALRRIRIKYRSVVFRNKTATPYLSGDGFSSLADIRINRVEDLSSIDGSQNPDSHLIFFVASHLFEEASESIYFQSNCRILICGNSDRNFTDSIVLPKVTSLALLQNSEISDNQRIFTLPIGIENARRGRYNYKKLLRPEVPKLVADRILFPPMSPTNPIREIVRNQAMRRVDLFDLKTEYLTERNYFALTNSYQFVLSLPGNGIEDHRIWETLYQGGYPVVIESEWSKSLRIYGLPILEIQSIDALEVDTLRYHADIFAKNTPQDYGALWFPHWEKFIDVAEPP